MKYKLKDLIQPISNKFNFAGKSNVIFLNTSDIYDGHISGTKIKPQNLPGQAKKSLKNGDILFSEIRPKNKRFAMVNNIKAENYVVSTKLMVLRNCNPNILDTSYFYFYLTSPIMLRYLQSEAESRSGTFPQITFEDTMANIEINLPPLFEQKLIVRKIETISSKIYVNNQINDNLLELLDTRFKQFISSSKLTDTTLHDIAIIHSGGNKPKKFSKVKTNEYSVPVYSNGVSKKGLFGFTNKAKVNERAVTVSARGTIGFTVLHNKPFVPIVRLVYLTYKSVPINFLYLLVRSLNIQGYGSTQQQITVPYLRKLKIKIPDANEINKFDAENLSLFDLIWIKEKENILLFKIKENLLEKYF